MVIHIDPGTAFGTGMHETTQLCIRGVEKICDIGDGDFGCWLWKRDSGDAGA